MEDNKNINPDLEKKINTEEPEEIIDEISNELNSLHDKLIVDATEVGKAKERIEAIRPIWVELSQSTVMDPGIAEMYGGSIQVLRTFRDDVKNMNSHYLKLGNLIGTITSSSDTVINTTSTTASFVDAAIVTPYHKWDPSSVSERQEKTKKGLSKLDPDLAETYKSVWEILYGTKSDSGRGSLFMLRQVFDHFFNILSPDDLVRKSQFWSPKKEQENKNQVTRRERIEYAAFTHIRDEFSAKRLAETSNHILSIYELLSTAHTRGNLDEKQTIGALREMQSILESWIESMGL